MFTDNLWFTKLMYTTVIIFIIYSRQKKYINSESALNLNTLFFCRSVYVMKNKRIIDTMEKIIWREHFLSKYSLTKRRGMSVVPIKTFVCWTDSYINVYLIGSLVSLWTSVSRRKGLEHTR